MNSNLNESLTGRAARVAVSLMLAVGLASLTGCATTADDSEFVANHEVVDNMAGS